MSKLKKFRRYLINEIEKPDEKGVLQGRYIVDEELKTVVQHVKNADEFVVCGEDESEVFHITITKVYK